jgi:hypothetical protein
VVVVSDSGTGSTDRRQAHIETVEIESDVIRSDGDNYAIRINIEYDRLGDADIYYIGDIFFVDMRSGTVAKQLREGESVEVVCADTNRSLTVTRGARYVEREPYQDNGLLVTLEGYGTEYTLKVPERDRPAKLRYPSGDVMGELVKDIRRQNDDSFGIVAEQTAGDLGIPER